MTTADYTILGDTPCLALSYSLFTGNNYPLYTLLGPDYYAAEYINHYWLEDHDRER